MSRKKAIEKLWRAGELSWKLKGKQKDVYKALKEGNRDIDVILISRRFGKSFINCLLATEICIKNPDAIVKYACPTQKMVKQIIKPIMRTIFEDAPDEYNITEIWKEADKEFVFPNGAKIQLAGADQGNIENLRGGYAHLCICDEAGFMDDLKYAVESVLMPTTDTVDGRLIMTSTPSYKDPNHEFHEHYVFPMEAEGSLIKYTLHDSPMVSDEKKIQIMNRYYGGSDNPQYRCEYLCEIPRSVETSIVPEFVDKEEEIVIDEYEVPPYRDYYVSMDVGFRDLTAVLFGYYDFNEATLYIMDEFIISGLDVTTRNISNGIKDRELRVMDNDLKFINDLASEDHRLTFIATEKHNKDSAISKVRTWITQGRIKIHKRCKHLIYHCKSAQWATTKNGTLTGKFKHIKDSPSGDLKGGHADALDALIYMVRNVHEGHNPYPDDYDLPKGSNYFYSNKNRKEDRYQEIANKMFNTPQRTKKKEVDHKQSMWKIFNKRK
jgi:hypothetical protein